MTGSPSKATAQDADLESTSLCPWSYFSTIDAFLPAMEDELEPQQQDTGTPSCSCTTRNRYLLLCVGGTLLEMDLETACVVAQLNIGQNLVSMSYLHNRFKHVVGLTESGYLKHYDLVRGRVATLAFALKKNQSLGDDTDNSSVKFAASSVTPGIFWSIGKSHSVYWLSLKRSREVLEKQHLPTIEDVFRIKSGVKQPIVAMASFEKAPLLIVGRAGGSLEIYNTASFKMLQQVQLNMQKMVDMQADQSSANTFSICCLGHRGTGTHHVHHLECIFSEGSYSNIAKIHPRDPLCSVSSHLVGSRPKVVHLQNGNAAVVNQDTNSITQVSLGHHNTDDGGSVTRLEALNTAKRESLPGFGPVEEPSCLCLFGLNPHLETIFVCRKVTEERNMAHLQLDIFQSLGRLKEDCGRNHNTCIGYDMKQNEASLGELQDDPVALSVMHLQSRTDKIEKFGVSFDASSNRVRVTLTEFSMSKSASKTSFCTEHAMPAEFKVDFIGVHHIYNRRFAGTEEGDCTCWLLQCSHNLVFLVWKQSEDNELGVEHFFGKTCRFIEHDDNSVKKAAYFCFMRSNQMEVYEKDLMIDYDSSPSACLSTFNLGGMTKTLQLLNCEFTSDPRNWSFLNCVWSSGGGVFVGIADKSSGEMEVQFSWQLKTEQEMILDQAYIELGSVKDSNQQFNIALLTNRRVLILNDALSVAKQFQMQENDGQVISIHWLKESNRLVCMTRSKVLELTNWAGFDFNSTLSLDMMSSPTGRTDSSCEKFKGVAFLGKRDIFYFNHQMQNGIQDTDILSYALSGRSLQKVSTNATGYKDRLVDELIKKLDPGIEVSDSQINVSIRGLKLYCHAKANVNGQKEVVAKWLKLLMTNPSQIDLRYNSDPLVRVCEEEMHALRIILNLLARNQDPSFAQKLFAKSKADVDSVDRVVDEEVELEFSGITPSYGLISTLVENPYLFDSPAPAKNNQDRRGPDQQLSSKTHNEPPQDAFATGDDTFAQSPSQIAGVPVHQGGSADAGASVQSKPDIPTPSLDMQMNRSFDSSGSDDSSSDEEGTSSFFGQPKKKKIMISIKPRGDTATPESKRAGSSSLQLKSAIAGLSLESPPLMSLQTPQPQQEQQRIDIGSPPLMDLQSPPVVQQPERQEGKQAEIVKGTVAAPPELSVESEKEVDAKHVEGSSFDLSSDDSDSDESSFGKKIKIKINPAGSNASFQSNTASTSDIKNMLSSLRSSIEGPLLTAEALAPQKASPSVQAVDDINNNSSKPPLPTTTNTTTAQSQDDSAADFQEGLKLLNMKRWEDAMAKFDKALDQMAKDIGKVKKYWLVVVHHRVYAALMRECETLNCQDSEQDRWVHRNLMLCARRLRLQSILGIQVSVFAAQSLMRTEEYQKSYALLDAMLKILPRYGAKMAQMTPKVTQMKQLCQAKIEVSVDIEENSCLATVPQELNKVQSTQELEQRIQQIVKEAKET